MELFMYIFLTGSVAQFCNINIVEKNSDYIKINLDQVIHLTSIFAFI